MATEIERKFIVKSDDWRRAVRDRMHIIDRLIARFDKGKARIRICGPVATLTVKGNRRGYVRSEFLLPLSMADALSMVAEFSAGPALEKYRHEVSVAETIWQVDEYVGALSGLVTADVELPREDFPLVIPSWAGRDITADRRYGSAALAERLVRLHLEPA